MVTSSRGFLLRVWSTGQADQNVDRAHSVGVLVRRLRRIEKDMSGDPRDEFSRFIPDGGEFALLLPRVVGLDARWPTKFTTCPQDRVYNRRNIASGITLER